MAETFRCRKVFFLHIRHVAGPGMHSIILRLSHGSGRPGAAFRNDPAWHGRFTKSETFSMNHLSQKFFQYCEQNRLVHEQDYILVAVSGGVDSVVLLHLLLQLSAGMQLKLEIVHVNHRLRGDEAERDQQFVEALADQYQLPCHSRQADVPKYIARNKLSVEEGARILRFQFFEQVLSKTGATSLALGHHADDQVETIIDHFLRGSGIRGLTGMAPKRDRYIRPLLCATRDEIETYATSHSLHYLVDSTNEMPVYRRNRIRWDLIPLLKKDYNAALSTIVLRTAGIMREAEDFLNETAKSAFETCLISQKKNKIILEIDAFLNYFIIIQKYIIYQILDRLNFPMSFLTTEAMDRILKITTARVTGKKVQVTPQLHIMVDHGQLVFHRQTPARSEFAVHPGNEYELDAEGRAFRIDLVALDQFPGFTPADKNIEWIDADAVIGPMVVRYFRNGDRFKPLHFQGEKKLSNYFTDLKIPLHERRDIPLLVCQTGIIWIMGFIIDDRFKMTSGTKRIMRLQVKRNAVHE